MAINLTGTFAGASALMLAAVGASADGRIDPRVCKRDHLSEETRAFCEAWQQMDARARFKFRVQERLRHTNQPPVAILEPIEAVEGFAVGPRLVELDGSRSFDPDGFVEFYTFQLFDGDTDEILSSAVTTRNPAATLRANRDLPPNLRATLIVEDDERATDTDELSLTGSDTTCSNLFFSCTTSSGQTGCALTSAVAEFSTDDLLDAAQRCDQDITESTMLAIGAWGGQGGKGADCGLAHGGAGGARGIAAMGTTVGDLDSIYGGPGETTYCFGIGEAGSHGDTDSGAGGASTILRTCQNVSQTETTGVLLVAGGGGGGQASLCVVGGFGGGDGGLAFSTTSDACPPSCVSGSTPNGGGNGGGNNEPGEESGGSGGTGGRGVQGGNGNNGIGGHGGPAADTGIPTWSQGNPGVTGSTGAGGEGGGGTGGGGYGGGAVVGNGGGGGGSYAARSTFSIDAIPRVGGSAGFLYFNFKP